MPPATVAASAVEACPAGGTTQGAAAAELEELRVREMSYNMLSGIGEQHRHATDEGASDRYSIVQGAVLVKVKLAICAKA